MKRDMDLVRAILLRLEEHEHGWAPDDFAIDGYTDAQVGFHAYIMAQAGLIETWGEATNANTGPHAHPNALTWAGYEFLDAAREPKRWMDAKRLIGTVGGASLAVWVQVLTKMALQNMGYQG